MSHTEMLDYGLNNESAYEVPYSKYFRLISSDGRKFLVEKEHVLLSDTITEILKGPGAFAEYESNEIKFSNIDSCVLQKVCEYFINKLKYSNSDTQILVFHIPDDFS